MTLYDTHAHFSDGDDVAALYARAAEAGVAHILAVGGSEELNRNALRTPGRVALGWDRDQLDDVPERMRQLPDLLDAHAARVAAIGEIGLDGHYGPEGCRSSSIRARRTTRRAASSTRCRGGTETACAA